MWRSTRAAAWLACACLCAPGGCRGIGAASLPEARRQAATERPEPPATPPARPSFLRELRSADPSVAPRSLAEVEVALAPLREATEAPSDPPPSAAVVEARRVARRGELEAASRLLLERVRQAPGDVGAWRELARVLDAAGRRDMAAEAWGRVLAVQPADPEALGAGGVDAAAARRPLQAAECLLRLRQMRRVGEAPQAEAGRAASELVALGLALRELGHLRAAATCLDEAAGLPIPAGAQGEPLRRQAGDLRRMAGECWQALGETGLASDGFLAALQAVGPEDRVALPRLVWARLASGRRWGAFEAVVEAQPVDAPGHEGLAEATRLLRDAWPEAPLSGDGRADTIAEIAEVPATVPEAGAELSAEAQARGPEFAIQLALRWIAADPEADRRVGLALRLMPVASSRSRELLLASPDDALGHAALLLARFELAGGEPEAAAEAIRGHASWRMRPGLMIAALEAAAAMEDRQAVLACVPESTDSARVACAVAEALAIVGDLDAADRWAERAIELDAARADVWLARSAVDVLRAGPSREAQAASWRQQAALSAERAWEAEPGAAEPARRMLELAAADAGVQAELRELVVSGPGGSVSRREWDRHQAVRRAQQGQGEPVLETLRALLLEDPSDATVAASLVLAAASAGELPAVTTWLERLATRRPASPSLLEAVVSAKARQGRLPEAVQLLREASLQEPRSASRRRAWARGLSVAGRQEEAWSVLSPLCGGRSGPRATLECVEQALRSGQEAAAVDMLRSLASASELAPSQRLAVMTMAMRVPRNEPSRRDLLAAAGRAAMGVPGAGATVLAAAMLGGTDADAAAVAASDVERRDASAVLEAAQFLLDEGRPDRSEVLLETALARASHEDRRTLERALVAVLCARGRQEVAERRVRAWWQGQEAALLMDPDRASLAEDLNELGGSLLLAGHPDAAESLFERAVEADASLGSALNNLAWLRIERGAIDTRTADLVRRALTAQPDDPSTLDTAAWWRHLQPEAGQDAIEQLQRATAGEAPSLEAMDHLGDALWAAGRRQEAARSWRQVVEAAGGRASRDRVMKAFDLMQRRVWGVRAWDAASFYDAGDGAAIERAQAKLKALAEGGQPPVTPRPAPPPADPAPPTDDAP